MFFRNTYLFFGFVFMMTLQLMGCGHGIDKEVQMQEADPYSEYHFSKVENLNKSVTRIENKEVICYQYYSRGFWCMKTTKTK